jgi:hypothetical protein
MLFSRWHASKTKTSDDGLLIISSADSPDPRRELLEEVRVPVHRHSQLRLREAQALVAGDGANLLALLEDGPVDRPEVVPMASAQKATIPLPWLGSRDTNVDHPCTTPVLRSAFLSLS